MSALPLSQVAGKMGQSGTERAEDIATALQGARVLVVDDNQVNLHLLTAILERGGIGWVEVASDGMQALARLPNFDPDLLLLDLMMPGLDGFEVCRRVRALAAFRHLPVLVQSSLNRAEDRARAFAAGATDYISKPINANELISRVRNHLRNRILVMSLQHYRRRREAELNLARRMQQRLLPRQPQIEAALAKGLVIRSHFAPSSELGGDLWGLFTDRWGRQAIWLIDFSGHGVAAALNTFRLHVLLQQIGAGDHDPAGVLAMVNRRLCSLLPQGQFATMLVGVVDPEAHRFIYATAAATRPLVWSEGDRVPRLGGSAGLPLGLTTRATYENRELGFGRGTSIFLYSDAATEIAVGNGILDEEGFVAMAARLLIETNDDDLLPRLLPELAAVGTLDDDLTALVIRRT